MEILYVNSKGRTVINTEISFRKMEKVAGQILQNPKRRQQAIFLIAYTGYILANSYNPVVYAYGPNNINSLGIKFWSYVKVFAKWGCLIMAGVDTIKTLNAGDTKSLNKVIYKYIIAYALISWLPWIFDEIDTVIK